MYSTLFPDIDILRVVDGNDQSADWTSNETDENAFVIFNGPNPDTSFRWTYGMSAGGGDDVIYLASGRHGIVRGGDGADIFIVGSGSFVGLRLADFDITEDQIFIDASPLTVELDTRFPVGGDARVSLIDRRPDGLLDFAAYLTMDFSIDQLIDAGALSFTPGILLPDFPEGLEDIGDALRPLPARLAEIGALGPPSAAVGDGAQFVTIGGSEYFNGNVGHGADIVLLGATHGGFVGLGGSAGSPPTSVYTGFGDRISIPGTSSTTDNDADILIVTPAADGEWRIGQEDSFDTMVLWGFDDIQTFEDLQLRSFDERFNDNFDFAHTLFQLTETLSVRADFDAEQIAIADGNFLSGSGRLEGSALADLIMADGSGVTLVGNGGGDYLQGGDGSDTLNGGAGDDTLNGGIGEADLRDIIYAGAGNDMADGGHGNDLIYGMDGDDILAGGFGTDNLQGQNGNDTITGSALSDLVYGGAGDDFVNGGFGFDRINGGSGADTFFHVGLANHGSDWIQDYSSAEGDRLLVGLSGVSATDFRVVYSETTGAGTAGVAEAFVRYLPTDLVLFALVDGADAGPLSLHTAEGESFIIPT